MVGSITSLLTTTLPQVKFLSFSLRFWFQGKSDGLFKHVFLNMFILSAAEGERFGRKISISQRYFCKILLLIVTIISYLFLHLEKNHENNKINPFYKFII